MNLSQRAKTMDERKILKYNKGIFSWESAPFADECKIDIYVNGLRQASVMATPMQLDYLAVGFLFGENLINGINEIANISISGHRVSIELNKTNISDETISLENVDPNTIQNADLLHPQIDASEIIALTEEFNRHSYSFRLTGAVHSCCLVDGNKRYFADDVARHNALDKVIGQYLLEGPSGSPGLVLTTGRISTEILIKSAKAGLGMLISRSAATNRAVELARRLNMILIGFSRDDRFNVYHGGDMILGAPT